MKETIVPRKNLDILNAEVAELLRKDAIEKVPPNERGCGFFSTFFLVPKKNGKMRPVINLRPLNRYLKKEHFKMDTLKKVINLVKPNDWAISLDLSDAYLHIPIFQKHRKYLRFCIAGQCWQWKCLCFGPSTAPPVFSKVISVIAAHLRAQNIRLASYLDDWLDRNQLKRLLLQDREKCLIFSGSTGLYNKQREIRTDSQTRDCLHRGCFPLKARISNSNSREIKKVRFSNTKVTLGPKSSKRFSSSTRPNGFMSGINSQWPTFYETHTITSVSFLASSINGPRSCGSHYATSKIASSVVVRSSQHHEGSLFATGSYTDNPSHGCIKTRLWGPCGQRFYSGNMV